MKGMTLMLLNDKLIDEILKKYKDIEVVTYQIKIKKIEHLEYL